MSRPERWVAAVRRRRRVRGAPSGETSRAVARRRRARPPPTMAAALPLATRMGRGRTRRRRFAGRGASARSGRRGRWRRRRGRWRWWRPRCKKAATCDRGTRRARRRRCAAHRQGRRLVGRLPGGSGPDAATAVRRRHQWRRQRTMAAMAAAPVGGEAARREARAAAGVHPRPSRLIWSRTLRRGRRAPHQRMATRQRVGRPSCLPPPRRLLPRPPTRPQTLHQRGQCWPTGAGVAPPPPLPDVRVAVG